MSQPPVSPAPGPLPAPPIPTLAPPPAQGATATRPAADLAASGDPVLCGHCGRTASNGISCQGICVADSGY